MTRTPSCFSNSSRAIFPGIVGIEFFLTGGNWRSWFRYKAGVREASDAGPNTRESSS